MTQTTLNIGVLAIVISLLALGMHAQTANAQRSLLRADVTYGVSAPANAADAIGIRVGSEVAVALDAGAVAR